MNWFIAFGCRERSHAALAVCLFVLVTGGLDPAGAADAQRMVLYVQGRNAYEAARVSGDFSQALLLARELAAREDKNGERLLKMVYLQLGWGAHKDYVQAYGWLSDGIAGGADYLLSWRKRLADKMTPEQLTQARKRAGN